MRTGRDGQSSAATAAPGIVSTPRQGQQSAKVLHGTSSRLAFVSETLGEPRPCGQWPLGGLVGPQRAMDKARFIGECPHPIRNSPVSFFDGYSQGFPSACALHRPRPDPRPLRSDLRAPARRLGRQRHQDRDAAGRRRAASAPGGPREGSDFQNLHRNKRGITLNLKSPEGRAAFLRMVEKADVVVENFRPDVKQRLGDRLRGPEEDQPSASSTAASPASARTAPTRTARASTRSRRAWAG